MICPGCNKENIYEISVCVTCGTMMNDSVREELALKITHVKKEPIKLDQIKKDPTPKITLKENPIVQEKSFQPKIKPSLQDSKPFIRDTPNKPAKTTEISIKPTSPTLVEFQNKNAQLPEWRLQLQNAVKQRQSESKNVETSAAAAPVETISAVTTYPTQGSAALKVQADEITLPEDVADNAHLKNALARIESSRKRFLQNEPETVSPPENSKPKQTVYQNNLRIATKDDKPAPISQELKTSADFAVKPKLVPAVAETKIKDFYDTSELDPEFVPAKISSSFDKRPATVSKKDAVEEIKIEEKAEVKSEEVRIEKVEIEKAEIEQTAEVEITDEEEIIDDFAPFSLRFNAGLFDLIIGSFLSLLLLSPFMILGGNWFTLTGFFAFLATCAVVMFIYQTISIGVFGKTFGMHLFSLEMIDLDGEQYPTFHQAAVSSAIYLLSLAFLGMGFITSIFDEERRSIHDIVSGTLVVKEI